MTNQKNINEQIADILAHTKLEHMEEIDDQEVLPGLSSLLAHEEETQADLIGQNLGHWCVMDLIGQGGMSKIYLAQRNDQQLQQTVALKVMSQGLTNETHIQRFLRERQILSDLTHPNIAKLYDVGVTHSGAPWLAMEWVNGQDILAYTMAHEFNIEQKIVLFKQVCDAMAYAHSKGIIHRDLKPGNILVTRDQHVKLLDFGIAANETDQSLTMTGMVMGTPGYMSPEQAKGLSQQLDRRSDVFSAGVLLYKLLQGALPFRAESVSEISYKIIHEEPTLINQHIHRDLQAIVFKCLEKNPDDRYSSFKLLNHDIDAYLSGDVVTARKVTSWGRLIKKSKKNKTLTTALFGAVLATIFGITYGIHQTINSQQKINLTKKYLAKTQSIKNRIRQIHMLPFHDVQHSYSIIERDINSLKNEIAHSGYDDEGLSEFAIGAAYFDMRKEGEAWQFLIQAESAGHVSADLDIYLGLLHANQWQRQKKQANAIENGQQRDLFTQQARQQFYQPAIDYLSRAQKEQADTAFLMAHVAFIEGDLETAIELSLKDSKQNPWHYESLLLIAEAYSQMATTQGAKEGHDLNADLLKLSNDYVNQALSIGDSDPKNHSMRCQFSGRDMANQKYFNYENAEHIYQQGLSHCQMALKANPKSAAPHNGLYQLHRSRAEYQEYIDRVSLNKYNDSISDEALDFYQKSLSALDNGLALEPDHFDLILHQIKPLYTIAFYTYLHGGDPMPLYNRALNATQEAQQLNVLSSKPILQKAYVYSEMSYYFMTVIKDLSQARYYAEQAIKAAQQAHAMNPVFTNVIRVNAYRYSLANVLYEQGNIMSAANSLRVSIRERFDVLPQRVAYFKNFNDIMRAQEVLLGLLTETSATVSEEVDFGVNMIDLVCTFDGLLEEQKQQLKTLMKPYLENNWVQPELFNDCLLAIE